MLTHSAALAFPQPIAPGRHRLAIDFTARINTFGRGLFSIDYPTDAGRRRLIATHLEPADARRIFPCWDEPGIKASFETVVTVPETFTAVSNMPVTHEEPAGAGLKRISFAPTPPMSSYLFVLAAGELERTTGDADGVEIGVVTTIGKRERGRYALDSAIALLRYYVDYFGVRYPLPKLDLIALPGGSNGAMENWGGITFFETRLLFDPGSSSERLKRDIFVVLAHEMAHLWFGDLVTMAWWDDLWLNEGFASWMQSKAAEQLNPGWTIWLESSGAKDYAMAADARRTSHPIRQPVADESEAMVAFDTITYTKGQAFIRQLEAYLGEAAFRDGIRRYIAAHAYGNATTADLWQALEAASGQPVAAIAAGYTEQSGVPLIRAETSCAGAQQQLHLVQERFAIHDPNALPRRWQVPLVIAPAGRRQSSERYLLSEGVLDITAGACGEPILLNAGGLGYYRVQYDEQTRQALAASFARLPRADRVTLLADGWALLAAEKMPPDDYFALIESLPADDVRAAWQSANRAFERLDRLERGRPQRSILRAYARRILRPAFDRLDWERAPSERVGRALLRSDLIWALGGYGDSEILAEARRRYEAFRDDPASLDPELRGAVIHLVGRTADRTTWEALRAEGRRATAAEERVRYYYGLASALDPALAADTLAIALSDELPANLAQNLIYWVASAGEQPALAWDFVRANFDTLSVRHGPPFRDSFVAGLMTNFTDRAHAAELAEFGPAHQSSGGRIAAARAEEAIAAEADFAARVLPAIEDWIAARTQ